jgi:cytochrome c1
VTAVATLRIVVAMVATILLAACEPKPDYIPTIAGGDAKRGLRALNQFECGVCHVIPGISGAVGTVGPSLAAYSRFPHLAGKFPNQPELLVQWIADAPSLAPGTAMPAIAMSDRDARDIAAYLYELN